MCYLVNYYCAFYFSQLRLPSIDFFLSFRLRPHENFHQLLGHCYDASDPVHQPCPRPNRAGPGGPATQSPLLHCSGPNSAAASQRGGAPPCGTPPPPWHEKHRRWHRLCFSRAGAAQKAPPRAFCLKSLRMRHPLLATSLSEASPPRARAPHSPSASLGLQIPAVPMSARRQAWQFAAALVFFHGSEYVLAAAFHGRRNVTATCECAITPSLLRFERDLDCAREIY